MDKFSVHIGASPKREALQLSEVDDNLRNSLWNRIYGFFGRGNHVVWDKPADRLAVYYFKVPVDELPYDKLKRAHWIKERFYKAPWHGAYDLVEFLVHFWGLLPFGPGATQESVRNTFNSVLESEGSGYRFIGNVLTPITNSLEIEAIESALVQSKKVGLAGAVVHLETAAKLLSLKPMPDYRNSVKESISAVESVAKLFSGAAEGGLSGALEELQKTDGIHGALKGAFVRMYGYSSDASGIRHAILEESTVGFDEAKYMLVACSAFVHYLAAKRGDQSNQSH